MGCPFCHFRDFWREVGDLTARPAEVREVDPVVEQTNGNLLVKGDIERIAGFQVPVAQ